MQDRWPTRGVQQEMRRPTVSSALLRSEVASATMVQRTLIPAGRGSQGSLIVVRRLRPVRLRARAAAERHEVIANRADLRFGIAVEMLIIRLRVIRPERRHARAGENGQRALEPVENP